MTADTSSTLGAPGGSPDEVKDFIVDDWAIPALIERGFKKINDFTWAKRLKNRGNEARLIVSFEKKQALPATDIFIELELTHRKMPGGTRPYINRVYAGYFDELYVPHVVDALVKAYKSAWPAHRYAKDAEYRDAISMFVGPLLRDALPQDVDVSQVWRRPSMESVNPRRIGEAADPKDYIINLPPHDADDARRELLDVDEPWDGPWHDPLRNASFERVNAATWYKQYPFLDGYVVVLAEPHLNMPDLEGTDQTKPTIRLYAEYSNPMGGVDYPVQVFQRWVPLHVFPEAIGFVDRAVTGSNSLDNLQHALEPGFYRLVPPLGPLIPEAAENARDFIVGDSLVDFRNAMEENGWKFKKLAAVPKVGGGTTQEHVFKYVSDGTIWTVNASVLPDGRLYAFGHGFKVLQGYDSRGRECQEDDEWDLPDQTQEVGMSASDFAALVTDNALSHHGKDPETHEFEEYDPRAEPEYWEDR